MLFTAYFVSAAMLLVTSVNALPQEDNSLVARGGCTPGYYRLNGACTVCTAGYSCSGDGGRAMCDTGHASPAGWSGQCTACEPGFYAQSRGQTVCDPCPRGSYAPNYASNYCNGVSNGWFQNYTGKAFKCGACCGWEAKGSNFNFIATNCSSPAKPNSDINSGDGCKANKAVCTRVNSCTQNSDGSCPDGSPTSYQK